MALHEKTDQIYLCTLHYTEKEKTELLGTSISVTRVFQQSLVEKKESVLNLFHN